MTSRALVSTRSRSLRWLFLVYLGFAFVALRGVVFAPGAIGLRNDWEYVPLPGETASNVRHALTAWSENGLGSAVVRSGPRPFQITVNVAALVFGLNAAIVSKLLPLLAIALAGLTSNILIFSIVRRGPPAFFGSLIYAFSPLLFNLVVQGHTYFLLSYALLPLLIVTFSQALSAKQSIPWILLSGLVFALLIDNVQIVSLISLLFLFLHTVIFEPGNNANQRIRGALKRASAVALVAALVQAQLLVPMLLNPGETRSYVQQVVDLSWNRLESPGLVSAFTLDGAGFRYLIESIPKNVVPWWTAGHIVFFALVLSTLAFRHLRRQATLWSLVALLSLFLFKGVNPPLGAVNRWLLDHVLLMSAFRNVQYFTILTNLALGILLAIWMISAPDFIHRWLRIPRLTRHQFTVGLYALLAIVLILHVYPFLNGNFNREIQVYQLHPDYASWSKSVHQNHRDGRWLLLPPAQPMRYDNFRFAGFDPLERQGVSVTGGEVAVAHPWQSFLTMLLYTARPFDPRQLLCDSAVHSILARRDFISETPRFQWDEFPKAVWTNEQLQLAISGWRQLTEERKLAGDQATLYNVTQPCGRLTTTGPATLSSGTLSDTVDLSEYWEKEKETASPVLYTSQQTAGLLKNLPDKAIDRVTVSQNNLLDLTRLWLSRATEVPITNLTRDTKQGFSPLNNWWWKDWHYAAVLDPGAVVATDHQTGRGVFTVEQAGQAELWLKAMHSRAGSTLTLRVDNQVIGEVSTHEPLLQGLAWIRLPLGRLTAGQHTVTVSSGGGENLLARLLVVADGDAALAEQATAKWLFGRDVVLALTFATRNLAAYPGIFGAGEAGQSDESGRFSLAVPRDGAYTVSVKAATRQYVSAVTQLESDYLDTIAQGKSIGQTFELESGAQLLHSLKFKLEARYPGSNVPAATIPDAPLTATVYRFDDTTGTKELVAQVDVAAHVAPVNDQWDLIDVPIEISLDGRGGRFLVELTSPATKVGWAIATVADGFGNKADHYSAGAMTVNGESQRRDLVFVVLTQVGSPQTAGVQFDNKVLPLSTNQIGELWQELGSVELLAGSHTVTLPINNPHLRIDQIILRSAGTAQPRPQPPVLAYRRTRPTSLQTVPSVSGQTPYWLILKDTWHDGWQAKPRSNYHLVVNGFANAWWIEPPSGPYQVSVRYTPQRYTDVGLIISGVALVGAVSWLLWRRPTQLTALLDPWRGKQMPIAIGAAILFLLTASVLAVAGRADGAQAAASVGFVCFAVAVLLQVLKGSKVSARMQGILVILVLIALICWRLASQLDQPAARQAIQPPVVTTSQ